MVKKQVANATALGLFILIVLGMGIFLGIWFGPGEWYATLEKPSFNPPNWVFGPAWTVLYVLIAIAGWRTWLLEGFSGKSMKIWYGQMLLNWLWTPIFFGAQAMAFAFLVILCLLFVIVSFIGVSRDLVAKLCFIPYALWVAFASLLNGTLLLLNN